MHEQRYRTGLVVAMRLSTQLPSKSFAPLLPLGVLRGHRRGLRLVRPFQTLPFAASPQVTGQGERNSVAIRLGGKIMTLTAYNQVPIPSFMYGTAWKKAATKELVQLAVASGFRAIDTANQRIHYEEALVGEAVQALDEQGIKRDNLFVQTKFTPVDGQGGRIPYDASADLTTQVRQSFDSSLNHLCTDYLDSYVLHAPYSRRRLGAADWEVWAAMEALNQSGKTKMIGI